MSNQDYVTRPRSPNKKHNPYKSTKKPANVSLKTKLIGLVAILAILGFGYFLWIIKDNQPAKEISIPSKRLSNNTHSLPKLPTEKWSYRKDLADKSVEQGTYKVTDMGPWKMQCASFRTNAQAETLKAKIAFVGLEAKVVKAQNKSGAWYKVILGPYKHKRAAEKDKHKMKNNHINFCQIWLWR